MFRPLLQITNLHVSVEHNPILKGISLTVHEGELHAIMGPNGSGKSTLVQTLMGHPAYEVTGGSVTFRGHDLLAMAPDERARAGLFLAFQYPREIAGVSLRSFLFAAYSAQQRRNRGQGAREKGKGKREKGRGLSPIRFKRFLEERMRELKIDTAFAERPVNQGFSGGEKKKSEILQLKVLQPTLALLDETDSGLDIDALKTVAGGINALRRYPNPNPNPNSSFLLVTHYARILAYLTPDRVHVMIGGRIVETGTSALAGALEKEGYAPYLQRH